MKALQVGRVAIWHLTIDIVSLLKKTSYYCLVRTIQYTIYRGGSFLPHAIGSLIGYFPLCSGLCPMLLLHPIYLQEAGMLLQVGVGIETVCRSLRQTPSLNNLTWPS